MSHINVLSKGQNNFKVGLLLLKGRKELWTEINHLFRNILKLFLVLLLISSQHEAACFSDKADSLKKELSSSLTDDNFDRLLQLSDYYSEVSSDSALLFANQALRIGRYFNSDDLISKAYLEISSIYESLNHADSALKYLTLALDCYLNSEHLEATGNIYSQLGDLFSELAQLDSALKYYTLMHEYYINNSELEGKSIACRKIGLVQKRMSQFDIALEFYFNGLKLAELAENQLEVGNIMNNIGSVYKDLSKYDQALEYYKKAAIVRESIPDSIGLGGSYSNLGMMYAIGQNLDSAEYFYKRAITISRLTKKWDYLSNTLAKMSDLCLQRKETENAKEYIQSSIRVCKEHNLIYELIEAQLNAGRIYYYSGDYTNAIHHFNITQKLAIENKITNRIASSHYGLYLSLKAIDDYKTAINHLITYYSYKDSLYDEKNRKSIAEIETKYETEIVNNNNKMLRLQQEKDKNQKRLLVATLGILGLFLFFLVFFFINKNNNMKKIRVFYENEKNLNQSLKESSQREKEHYEDVIFAEKKINQLQQDKIIGKNRELTTLLMSFNSRNRVIGEVTTRIKDLENKKNIGLNDIKLIKKLIEDKNSFEEDWQLFRSQIEEVYPGFFEKLQKSCPEFTIHDLRFCSYLLIDLSTKEIADIMHVTDAAIIKQRQRVRKKLGIDNNAEFLLFLRQI
jgi:tetratricopeptide (TPR) repeat protein